MINFFFLLRNRARYKNRHKRSWFRATLQCHQPDRRLKVGQHTFAQQLSLQPQRTETFILKADFIYLVDYASRKFSRGVFVNYDFIYGGHFVGIVCKHRIVLRQDITAHLRPTLPSGHAINIVPFTRIRKKKTQKIPPNE